MMSANPISEKLLRLRQERNVSVEEINERTKIRLHVLAALEAGEFDRLDPAYMKSYLKEYALALRLSAAETEEILKEYSDLYEKKETGLFSLGAPQPQKIRLGSPVHLRKGGSFLATTKSKIIFFSILAGLLVIVGGAYALFFMPVNSPKQEASSQPLDISNNNNAKGNGDGKGLISIMNEEQLDSMLLEAHASDTAWISIVIDGQRSEQLILPPGQPKTWYAGKQFVLSVGNAGAVTLKRNGETFPPLGKKGAIVRSIKITKDDFQTSALPWNPASAAKKKSEAPQRPRPDITPVPPA